MLSEPNNFKTAKEYFEEALASGRLSHDPKAINYVGYYMFMGLNKEGKVLFKHCDTREYLA